MDKNELVSIAKEYSSLEVTEPSNQEKLQALESRLYEGMSEMTLDEMFEFTNKVREDSIRVNGQAPDNFMHGYGKICESCCNALINISTKTFSFYNNPSSYDGSLRNYLNTYISKMQPDQLEQLSKSLESFTLKTSPNIESRTQSVFEFNLDNIKTVTPQLIRDRQFFIAAENFIYNSKDGADLAYFYKDGNTKDSNNFDIKKYNDYYSGVDYARANPDQVKDLLDFTQNIDPSLSSEEVADLLWHSSLDIDPSMFYKDGIYDKNNADHNKFDIQKFNAFIDGFNDPEADPSQANLSPDSMDFDKSEMTT